MNKFSQTEPDLRPSKWNWSTWNIIFGFTTEVRCQSISAVERKSKTFKQCKITIRSDMKWTVIVIMFGNIPWYKIIFRFNSSVSLNMRGGRFHLFAESRRRFQGEYFLRKFKTIGHEEHTNFKIYAQIHLASI